MEMMHMRKAFYVIITIFLLINITYGGSANVSGTNVIISEVLYDAPNSDSTEEWIELYNPTSSTIDLTGWTISDNAGTFTLSGSIPANGFITIARDSAGFQGLYSFAPTLVMGSALALSNSGDRLDLKDASNNPVDFVAWENYVSGWSVTAVNTVIHRDSDVDTDGPSDWTAPGTLGTPMDVNGPNFGNTGPDTTAPTVNIISPADGSTVSGTTTISISASDVSGIVAYEILIDGVLKSTSTTYSWDTTTEVDQSVHTILARAQDGAGNWGETSISVTVDNTVPPPPSGGAFKVMTYNIEQSGINPDWKQVVKEENPDILILVEVGTWDDNNNALLNQYVDEFNAYFTNEAPYQGVVTQNVAFDTSGEAVLSRYPIVATNQLALVTLDDGSTFDPSHDFLDVTVNIDGTDTHLVASHLKCCSGATNEDKRDRAQEGIINYMDSLGNVPIMYMGDLNSFSPFDTGALAPNGDLGVGPMSMMVDTSSPIYGPYASNVHTWTDVFRTLNPTDPGFTIGHQNPTYQSRIDFILTNQFFDGYLVSSTVGDTPTADTGSDHYAVDVIIDFGGSADTTPPAQVTGLTASTVSSTQIDLSWTANTEADLASYNVYRDGVFLTSVTTNSYSDTGLTASTTYSYEVSAVDTSSNEGLKSAAVSATTSAPDTTAPARVTGLTATATGETTVDLSWNANTEADLASYNIYRDGVLVGSSTTTMFTDSGLTSLTTYSYEVSAVDTSNNEGQRSAVVSVTTLDTTAPAQVTGLTATATGETTVDLSWNANTEADLASYNVYRDGVFLTSTTLTTYSDSGLTALTTYSYSVEAVDNVGNVGVAASTSVTTPDLTAPSQVTGLAATAVGVSQIDLAWTANSETDLSYYNIYRDGVLVATTTGNSFSDTGLNSATTYTYEVSAVDNSGNEGSKSAPSSATTAVQTLGHVVISEVLYDAAGRDASYEWVELYNPTGAAVDLSGWTLTDNKNTFTLPSGTVIAAGSFLVIARNSNSFNNRYGFMPDVGGLNTALGNKGDKLTLADNSGATVDFVAWENYVTGWNIVARTDESIARIDLSVDTDSVSDWQVVAGGTPGTL